MIDLANPSEEHQMLREMIRDFVQEFVEPQAHEYDKKEQFNIDLFRELGELGLLGITVPEEYGGAGLDAVAATIAHEELSYSDAGFALAYLAHSMLFVNNLAYNGSEEQKTRILPKVCSGEWIGAMAMSEPDAGTDVLGLSTTAEKNADGDWVLNGRKMWITNGCIDDQGTPADIVWVYARTGYDEKGRVKLSTFLVEKGMPGFSVGQKIFDKTGMRASNTAELVFNNCIVPSENVLGKFNDGVSVLMSGLDYERAVLSGGPIGIMSACWDIVLPYIVDRKQFGQSIGSFQLMQGKIADMYTTMNACKSYCYMVAKACDKGKITREDAAGVLLYASEKAVWMALESIQCLGGNGYINEYPTGRLLRDAKLYDIGAGTNEIRRMLIGREVFKKYN